MYFNLLNKLDLILLDIYLLEKLGKDNSNQIK